MMTFLVNPLPSSPGRVKDTPRWRDGLMRSASRTPQLIIAHSEPLAVARSQVQMNHAAIGRNKGPEDGGQCGASRGQADGSIALIKRRGLI